MFEDYKQKLREMTSAMELATFNAELAQTFANDAKQYATEAYALLNETSEMFKEMERSQANVE